MSLTNLNTMAEHDLKKIREQLWYAQQALLDAEALLGGTRWHGAYWTSIEEARRERFKRQDEGHRDLFLHEALKE